MCLLFHMIFHSGGGSAFRAGLWGWGQVRDFNMLVGESLCMHLFVVHDDVEASVAVLLLRLFTHVDVVVLMLAFVVAVFI